MSLLPISLPLYPILNASDAVEKMLEKKEQEAKAFPSEDKKDAEKVANDTGPNDAGRPANQITAVEDTAAVMDANAARAGAETPPDPPASEDGISEAEPAEPAQAKDSYQLELVAAEAEPEPEAPEEPARLDKRT